MRVSRVRWWWVMIVWVAWCCAEVSGSPQSHRRRERYTDILVQDENSLNSETTIDLDTEECIYPCSCASTAAPDCAPGVVAERDGCGCCLVCPRQAGEPCGAAAPCDTHRGLVCRPQHRRQRGGAFQLENGICREINGLPCVVYNRTYEHGETFSLDCRTQCACQNGTYGCSSLCPQEHISPKGSCSHPRLVDVPGQCCREWMCDSQAAQQPPECQPTFTRWSRCSATCGVGLSKRRSNLNAACEATTETMLCQLRRCDALKTNPFRHPADTHHHVRKGHECKATHRLTTPVRLRFGPCFSRKLFRPKHCGGCSSPGIHCEPLLSTTVKVDFQCAAPPGSSPGIPSQDMELALEFIEPGEDMWRENPEGWSEDQGLQITVSVQWILKCRCGVGLDLEDGKQDVKPTAASGEVILHRVHRTAAP